MSRGWSYEDELDIVRQLRLADGQIVVLFTDQRQRRVNAGPTRCKQESRAAVNLVDGLNIYLTAP